MSEKGLQWAFITIEMFKIMSFLLDALGKAEKKRLNDEVPELRSPVQTRQWYERKIIISSALIVLMLISLLIGYSVRPLFEKSSTSAQVASLAAKAVNNNISGASIKVNNRQLENNQSIQLNNAGHKLSAISYSDTPAIRFAMINGNVMYEGDLLSSDEQLIMIKERRVILEKEGVQSSLEM